MRKISSPPEYDPRTVRPVGSRYATALPLPIFMAWIVGEIVIVQRRCGVQYTGVPAPRVSTAECNARGTSEPYWQRLQW